MIDRILGFRRVFFGDLHKKKNSGRINRRVLHEGGILFIKIYTGVYIDKYFLISLSGAAVMICHGLTRMLFPRKPGPLPVSRNEPRHRLGMKYVQQTCFTCCFTGSAMKAPEKPSSGILKVSNAGLGTGPVFIFLTTGILCCLKKVNA